MCYNSCYNYSKIKGKAVKILLFETCYIAGKRTSRVKESEKIYFCEMLF